MRTCANRYESGVARCWLPAHPRACGSLFAWGTSAGDAARSVEACHAGILSSDPSQRRIITCCKALWAIANLSVPWNALNQQTVPLDFTDFMLSLWRFPMEGIAPYSAPAITMMELSTFRSVHGQLRKLQNTLVYPENKEDNSHLLKTVSNSFKKIRSKFPGIPWNPDFDNSLNPSRIEAYLAHVPFHISLRFLLMALRLESPPYHFDQTCWLLRQSRTAHAALDEYLLHDVILAQMERLNDTDDTDYARTAWIDLGISELLSFWQPPVPYCILRAIITFLN